MQKTGKKFLALWLAVVMILSTASAAFADEPADAGGDAAVTQEAEAAEDNAVDLPGEEAEPIDEEAEPVDEEAEPVDEEAEADSEEAEPADTEAPAEAEPAEETEPAVTAEDTSEIMLEEVAEDSPLLGADDYIYPIFHIMIEADTASFREDLGFDSDIDADSGYNAKPASMQDTNTVWDALIRANEEMTFDNELEDCLVIKNTSPFALSKVFNKDASKFKLAVNDVVVSEDKFLTTGITEDDKLTMWFEEDGASGYLYFNDLGSYWCDYGRMGLRLLEGPKASSDAAVKPAVGYEVIFEELDDETSLPTGTIASAVSDSDGWLDISFPKEGWYRVGSARKTGVAHVNSPYTTINVDGITETYRVTYHAGAGNLDVYGEQYKMYPVYIPKGRDLYGGMVPGATSADSGKVFSFWSERESDPDGDYRVYLGDDVESDMDLYAQYQTKYTITYHAGDGWFYDWETDDKVKEMAIDYTGRQNLGSPDVEPPEGKVFYFWSTKASDPDGEEEFDPWDDLYEPANMDLYAQYTVEYKVTFDGNGGTFREEYYNDEDEYEIVNSPTITRYYKAGKPFDSWVLRYYMDLTPPEGKALAGWTLVKDSKDATNDLYENYTLKSDITVYARYISAVKATYDANGGYFIENNAQVPTLTEIYDEGDTISTYDVHAPAGKAFSFWSTKQSDPDGTYKVSSGSDRIWEDTTYYAQYETGYTITFDANGGKFNEDETQRIEQLEAGSRYTPSWPDAPDGYDFFVGWTTKADGSDGYAAYQDYNKNGASKDITFYAQYGKSVKVTYNYGKGYGYSWNSDTDNYSKVTVYESESTTYINAPSARIDDNSQVFAYWSSDEAGKDQVDDDYVATLTQPATLYAQYEPAYALTLDANGGYFYGDNFGIYDEEKIGTAVIKVAKSASKARRTLYSEYANHDGDKQFSFWSTIKNDPDGKGSLGSLYGYVIESDATLYAQYSDTVTITLDANNKNAYFHRWWGNATSGPIDVKVIAGAKIQLGVVDGDRAAFDYNYPYLNSRNNITFAYWSFDKEGKQRIDYNSWIPTKATTVYAQYAPGVSLIWIVNSALSGESYDELTAGTTFDVWQYSYYSKGMKVRDKYLVGWSLTEGGPDVGESVTIPAGAEKFVLYAVLSSTEPEADYSYVDDLLASASMIDRSLYTEESVKALEAAIAGVKKGLPARRQSDVNEMAYALEKALRGLELKEGVTPTSGVTRIYGDNRFGTSMATADKLKEVMGVTQFKNIVLATAGKFPDALAGGYLAYVKNAPILLISKTESTRAQVIDYIKKNLAPGGTIYVLGSEAAVESAWLKPLNLASDQIKRLEGEDRFGTNLAILKEVGVKAGDDILVATGTNYADALSASGVTLPILLVSPKGLKENQVKYLKGLTGSKFHILGAEAAVPAAIANALKTYGSVDRTAGEDRYKTSVAIAERFVSSPKGMAMAYAANFPDGLCGGPLAIKLGMPLILTKTANPGSAKDYAAKMSLKTGVVFGSDSLISDDAVRTIIGGDTKVTEFKPY